MANAAYYPLIKKDPLAVTVDMMTTSETAHIGDWIFISGGSAIVLSGARTSLGYHAQSGVGIALDQNPKWTNQGSAYYLTAMPVGQRGIYRVSAVTGSYTAGTFVVPASAGSGQVGQTGRTGQATVWTATLTPNRMQLVSAAGAGGGSAWSGVPNSAVGLVLRRHAVGETGQIEILIFPNLFGPGAHV